MPIINPRIDDVTTRLMTARMNGEAVDEEHVFAAAGMTVREYWRGALGEQCTPEDYARRVSAFMADPEDPGIMGDVFPVVPGNERPWYSWPPKTVVGVRTLGSVEGQIRVALREAYRTHKPFFVETREIGTPAPVADAAKTADFLRRFPTVSRVNIDAPPPPYVPSRTEILVPEATRWLVENYPDLVHVTLRAAFEGAGAEPRPAAASVIDAVVDEVAAPVVLLDAAPKQKDTPVTTPVTTWLDNLPARDRKRSAYYLARLYKDQDGVGSRDRVEKVIRSLNKAVQKPVIK